MHLTLNLFLNTGNLVGPTAIVQFYMSSCNDPETDIQGASEPFCFIGNIYGKKYKSHKMLLRKHVLAARCLGGHVDVFLSALEKACAGLARARNIKET